MYGRDQVRNEGILQTYFVDSYADKMKMPG